MTRDTDEALRLARALDARSHDGLMFLQDAAALIRRQHAEIARLREALKEISDGDAYNAEGMRYIARAALETK